MPNGFKRIEAVFTKNQEYPMSLDHRISFRGVESRDAAKLQAFAASCPPLDPHTTFSYWVLGAYEHGLCYIAEDLANGNRIVGMALAVASADDVSRLYLWQIGVAPEYRRSGIGMTLLYALAHSALRMGRPTWDVSIAPENIASRGLLERFVVKRGGSMDVVGNVDVTDVHYGIADHEELFRLHIGPETLPPRVFAEGAGLSTLPLFVYGNLLPGRPLAGLIAPHVRATTVATVDGTLHWHQCERFPILLSDTGDKVLGLRVGIAPDHDLLAMLAIEELGYGYEARWLPSYDSTGAPLGHVLAFTWPWRDESVGGLIPDGAFVALDQMQGGYDTSSSR